MTLASLLLVFASLVGYPAAVALVVNVLKFLGVVKDGQSDNWVTGLNVAGLAILFGLKVFAPGFDVLVGDATLARIVEALQILLGLWIQLGVSKATHQKVLKGVPVIGTSFSLEKRQIGA